MKGLQTRLRPVHFLAVSAARSNLSGPGMGLLASTDCEPADLYLWGDRCVADRRLPAPNFGS